MNSSSLVNKWFIFAVSMVTQECFRNEWPPTVRIVQIQVTFSYNEVFSIS